MKKTLLYVITQGEWGGAQRYVYDLVNSLKDDFEVFVAIGEKDGKNDLQNKVESGKWKVESIQLKHLVRRISPIHDILAVFELAKLYKTLKPDIIHLNSSKTGIIGALAKLLILDSRLRGNDKMRIIYTVHGWVFNEPSRKLGRWLYRFLERFTARWKNKIIVLSDRDYQDGLDSCFRRNDKVGKKKLVKIPLGIEIPKFLDREKARRFLDPRRSLPRTLIRGGDNILVGTIANLYKTKGLDVLIEAVKIIDNSYKLQAISYKLRVFIIGEGPERKNLELRIKNYELGDTVYLTGTIDNAAQYLKAFDLFVLPSRKEGTPYTILEAVAAELPIVATDVGGIKELAPNAISPENPEILAKAIIKTMENPASTKKNIPSLEEMINKTKAIYSSNYQEEPCL